MDKNNVNVGLSYKVEGEFLKQNELNNTIPLTHYQRIYKQLKENDFEVYSLGQKKGKCENGYVVIKENGIAGQDGNVVGFSLVDIIVFYPLDEYSKMELYVNKIKSVLKKLGFIRPTGNITPSIIDEEVEAYTCSIEYQIFKKL